jgi:hypothetical protein
MQFRDHRIKILNPSFAIIVPPFLVDKNGIKMALGIFDSQDSQNMGIGKTQTWSIMSCPTEFKTYNNFLRKDLNHTKDNGIVTRGLDG